MCTQVGTVKAIEAGDDDTKTLRDIKFQTGDFMDVMIKAPLDRAGPRGGRDNGRLVSRGRGVVAPRDDRRGPARDDRRGPWR